MSLNPTTSLCMIYLRAYARDASTRRGMVRSGRKAMHMLRMHWSACAVKPVDGAEVAADGLEHVPTHESVSDRSQSESGRQTVSAQGGHA